MNKKRTNMSNTCYTNKGKLNKSSRKSIFSELQLSVAIESIGSFSMLSIGSRFVFMTYSKIHLIQRPLLNLVEKRSRNYNVPLVVYSSTQAKSCSKKYGPFHCA